LGLQTDAPLKRGVSPFAGYRNAVQACEAYGYEIGEPIKKAFEYRTTHNTGVFRVYTDTLLPLSFREFHCGSRPII
jgi:formate C-acetyltransferase